MKWIAIILLGLCLVQGSYGQEQTSDEVDLNGLVSLVNLVNPDLWPESTNGGLGIVKEQSWLPSKVERYLQWNNKRIEIEPIPGATNMVVSIPNVAAQLDLRAQAVVAQVAPTVVTNTTTFPNPNKALLLCDCAVCASQKQIERTEVGLITYARIAEKTIPLEGRLLWATNRFYRWASGTNDSATNRVYVLDQ